MFTQLLFVVCSSALAAAVNLFGQTFTGDATYYGDQGLQETGACGFGVTGAATLPWTTGLTGPRFVALDQPLYSNGMGASAQCGLCIAVYEDPSDYNCTTCGTTPPSRTVNYVMVSNECPECATGSLDFAANGDGRFKIDWHAVQCQVEESPFVYGFSGSNPWYVKISIANTRVPVAAVSIRAQGQQDFAVMQGTADSAWLLFSGVPLTFPADVMVTSVLGDTVMDSIPTTNLAGPPVAGSAQFPHHPELECVGGSPSVTIPATCGDYCSSPYTEQPQPVPPSAGTESALTLSNITTLMNTTCNVSVPAYGICGGNQAGCVDCIDGEWPGSCCSSGFVCNRHSAALWQCDEIPFTQLPNNIPPFEQCGGLANCANTTAAANITGLPMCVDGPWADYQCTSGFLCTSYGSQYFRCDTQPAKFPSVSGASTESATPQTIGVASTCSF